MKKILALLIILSTVLALCACGETMEIEKEVPTEVTVVPAEGQKVPKPSEALEAEDQDSAQSQPEGMEPEPEVPPVQEVNITTENFLDYFEYVELPEYNKRDEKNKSGKVTCLYYDSGYYLKDGYILADEMLQDCRVEIGIQWNYLWFENNKNIKVDLASGTYEVTGKPTATTPEEAVQTGWLTPIAEGGPFSYRVTFPYLTALGNGKNFSTFIHSDVELVSASGTLYLQN